MLTESDPLLFAFVRCSRVLAACPNLIKFLLVAGAGRGDFAAAELAVSI